MTIWHMQIAGWIPKATIIHSEYVILTAFPLQERCPNALQCYVICVLPVLLLRWRYSPGWALAYFTIRLQASRSLALSLHSFIHIFLRSVDTLSNHLIFGLPLRLVAYRFPYIFFFLELRCLPFFLYDQPIVFFVLPVLSNKNNERKSVYFQFIHNGIFLPKFSTKLIKIFVPLHVT